MIKLKDFNIGYFGGLYVQWVFRFKRGRSFVRNGEAQDAILCDSDFRLSKAMQKDIRREINHWLQGTP
jgi:hypothetical protein